jgi:hypothetical protein
MRKLALALATTAILGMAAPAFAIESGTAAQTQTPVTQANVKAKTNVNATAKVVHHRRGVNLVQDDRGLHRGFTHSRYYGYVKTHHKSVPAKETVAH